MSRPGTAVSLRGNKVGSSMGSLGSLRADEEQPPSRSSSQLAFVEHEEMPATPAPEDLYGERELTEMSPKPVVKVKSKKGKKGDEEELKGFSGFLKRLVRCKLIFFILRDLSLIMGWGVLDIVTPPT